MCPHKFPLLSNDGPLCVSVPESVGLGEGKAIDEIGSLFTHLEKRLGLRAK